MWHRIGVYWGLREDPELEARWKAGRPDLRTTVVSFTLGTVVAVAMFALAVLGVRALLGMNTDVGSVVWTGIRLLWAGAVLATLAAAVLRWGRWLAGRRAR